jgi:predicted TIM-barrel fold metal-dependent hydrolase
LSIGADEKPAFEVPAHSCDSHFHIFSAPDRYPYAGDLRYVPPVAELDDYRVFADRFGLERMVFVQPSAYGRDNRCMLDAMASVARDICRGIVDIDDDVSDREMARMNDLGVRGVRINTSPVKAPEPGYAESLLPRIRRIEARCAEIGWHLDFLCPGWLTTELMGCFRSLKTPYSLAPMGMYLARDGVGQPGFQQLLDLLRNGNGNAWAKFTGTYRMSKAPGFADVTPMAQALIEAAPDRIIWGSDYPHLSFADKASSGELFNLLAAWAPDAGTRRAILVDNPGRLFGF